MSTLVVVGAQWGDEGKGKVVDVLAEKADAVFRFGGGNNAGHTLVVNGKKIVTHLVPSGCAYPETICALGAGMVIDPEVLSEELAGLRAQGYMQNPDDLRISLNSHVIFPFMRDLDGLREDQRGNGRIGTTRRGIGPTYEAKTLRCGIRMRDLLNEKVLRQRLMRCKAAFDPEFYAASWPVIALQEMLDWAKRWGEVFDPYMTDVGELCQDLVHNVDRVLFEGAQGAMLDVDHGTYPYVTSSNTTAGAVCTGVGGGWDSEEVTIAGGNIQCTIHWAPEWGKYARAHGGGRFLGKVTISEGNLLIV